MLFTKQHQSLSVQLLLFPLTENFPPLGPRVSDLAEPRFAGIGSKSSLRHYWKLW